MKRLPHNRWLAFKNWGLTRRKLILMAARLRWGIRLELRARVCWCISRIGNPNADWQPYASAGVWVARWCYSVLDKKLGMKNRCHDEVMGSLQSAWTPM